MNPNLSIIVSLFGLLLFGGFETITAKLLSHNLSKVNYFDELDQSNKLNKESIALLNYKKRVISTMQYLSKQFNSTVCDYLVDDNVAYKTRIEVEEQAKSWRYRFDKQKLILDFPNKCQGLKEIFGFNEMPLSDEEAEYPLAYGILAYKFVDQIYYMLSAFYHPQNEYCIALDGKTSIKYKKAVDLLQTCFPNIRVIHIDTKVNWCDYGVLNGVLTCMRYLVQSKTNWKYYQYLSGFDLPLKTNREMVRIFKQLNDTLNMEILRFPYYRYGSQWKRVPYKMKLFKTSLSALIPYKAAKVMVEDEKAIALYDYLKNTVCPDESFWLTVAGNPEILPMPGSINASKWLELLEYKRSINLSKNLPLPYYISRFQVWNKSYYGRWCKGKMVSESCAFGIGDVSTLVKRPEMIAHKLYFDFQPAAYFCLYKHVRERALAEISTFNAQPYADLPFVAVSRGADVNDVLLPILNHEYY